jgi:GNAT superfamily N-acetyltransferase
MKPAANPTVRQATVSDVPLLTPLFDAYRQFYHQPSEPDRTRRFLLDRFEHNQSVIFIAESDAAAVGFTQLYPSFSSGALARIFILNDLFVDPSARRSGAGRALLNAATDYARCVGALRLVLSTELTNTAAQSLYEKSGWKKETGFYTYQLELSKSTSSETE